MTAEQTRTHELTIRRLDAGDDAALRRLAELEGRAGPAGELLGALIGDRLLAALSIGGGGSVADPFAASAHALDLLALRAEQMRRAAGGSWRSRLRRPRRRRATSRGGLGGSPPGGGGRLLQL